MTIFNRFRQIERTVFWTAVAAFGIDLDTYTWCLAKLEALELQYLGKDWTIRQLKKLVKGTGLPNWSRANKHQLEQWLGMLPPLQYVERLKVWG